LASITRRQRFGRVCYLVRVRLRGHPVRCATFDRLSEARAWAASTEADIRELRHFRVSEAARRTVAELVERYLLEVLPEKAVSTQADQVRQLRWWAGELGRYTLAGCTSAVISEAAHQRLAESSPATANRYLAVLSHAFSVACRQWHWATDNPVLRVAKFREPRGRTRFLSDDERGRLLAACKASAHPWLYPVVVLALSTGMRSAEVMGLTWRRVDLERGRVTLEDTKNGEARAVPISGLALDLLRQHKASRRTDTDLLWPGRRHPPRPIVLRKHWLAAVAAADLRDFRFHDLRHSACAYLLMSGATIPELAEVLGHKTLDMVRRYSHMSEQHAAGVLARMTDYIFPSSED